MRNKKIDMSIYKTLQSIGDRKRFPLIFTLGLPLLYLIVAIPIWYNGGKWYPFEIALAAYIFATVAGELVFLRYKPFNMSGNEYLAELEKKGLLPDEIMRDIEQTKTLKQLAQAKEQENRLKDIGYWFELKEKGAITEDEYLQKKKELL